MLIMSIMAIQIIAALFIWIVSITGGLSAIFLYKKFGHGHNVLQIAEAFAGGIFLGAALFHMLPDAENALHLAFTKESYPLANLICAGGFCLLLFLEQIVHHFQQVRQRHSINLVPLLLTFLISIHALSEGIALGVNQKIASILIIFVAITVHKGSEGFAVGTQLNRGSLQLGSVISLFLFFSLMSPLGVSLGIFAHHALYGKTSELLTGIFNAFAAGTFLYLATLHKLHHQHHTHSQLSEFFATLMGLGIMAGVAVWT
jgi:solute carrier family 39 (zinc transporter), member 1/2/3